MVVKPLCRSRPGVTAASRTGGGDRVAAVVMISTASELETEPTRAS
jgi:hypothetical protein